MKEALKNDRARIQVGRISSFGLMEMSRQRLRTGVLEASTKPCPHCEGSGLMRTASSAGLSALRIIEDEAARGRGDKIVLRAGRDAAVYVLNKKRAELADIEHRYGVSIEVVIDESFEGARMTVESSGPRPIAAQRSEPILIDDEPEDELDEVEAEGDEEEAEASEERGSEGDGQGRKRRRRRRGGRGRSRRDAEDLPRDSEPSEAAEPTAEAPARDASEEGAPEPGKRRRRRRGRKGGEAAEATDAVTVEPDSSPMVETPLAEEPPVAEAEVAEEPKPKARRRKKAAEPEAVEVVEAAPVE